MVHEHHFGQGEPKAGEARTKVVVILTAVTMAALGPPSSSSASWKRSNG